MPIASMALAMVLAVYMPPQAPAPGQDVAYDVRAVVVVDLAGDELAVALKRRHDVQRLVFVVHRA